ncbi:MAG: SGNH/GDSL hydrolase family protein [Planctomycetaceae bacterium]|nr:SGNH/GDSL hydrolase family protein [Planctomycetaceae bacterium]
MIRSPRLRFLPVLVGLVIVTSPLLARQEVPAKSKKPTVPQKKKSRKKKRRVNPAFAPVTDDPKLPRVLLIGDSISIGYTTATRKLLKGVANVHRIPVNGGPTTRGLASIEKWLGKSRWDVIHVNWGLHDLKYIKEKHQVPLDEYEQNLGKLLSRLKKTGAKVIWCSTTPVPEGVSPRRKDSDVVEYNTVAGKIAVGQGLLVNDLYKFALPRLKKIQRPRNVHFSPEGSRVLAGQVATSIRGALKP